MEYMSEVPHATPRTMLCCQCGCEMESNPANMCVACLRASIDITEGIPKQGSIYFCRSCERYLQPPALWLKAALESRELLSICLKKIKGLNKLVRLVDAGFIWTEPHSKRIKVKLTIQKEVLNGAVLQQVFVVEFVVHNQMCEVCHRVEAKDFWRACVQLRQKTSHKKTLLYLEQLMLKHRAHSNTSSIKPVHDGLDFFYAQKQDARKLVEFLQAVVPCRYKTAEELISHDAHNNVHNYKHTFSVEVAPVCRDDIVCLSPSLARQLGTMGQIAVVGRVTQSLHLIDPVTCRIAEVSGSLYWRSPFYSLCSSRQLTEYTVMDIELIREHEQSQHGAVSHKHLLADVWVVKSSELGVNDQHSHCRTHLGHLLNIGDTALGFDLRTSNLNNGYLEKMPADKIPDVILVKKFYANSQKRSQRRKWRLKRFDGAETADSDRDYHEFLEELEEDADYRQNINIYKDATRIAVDTDDTDDEGAPRVSLAEMLDDLHLDATGEDGADMLLG